MKTIIEMARKAGFVEYELEDYTQSGYDIRYERFAALVRADERDRVKEALAQPERQWVGLRDIEIASAFEGIPQSFRDKEIFTKAIEAKLKEKNT